MPDSIHNNSLNTGEPIIEQENITDTSRNTGITTENAKSLPADERTFNLLVDDVPYIIKAVPFTFNEDVRFYVNINGNSDHVFTWDSESKIFRAIDDAAATLPDALEGAISQKLQSQQK